MLTILHQMLYSNVCYPAAKLQAKNHPCFKKMV
uniref:Uncharacterized protein n=1 Tax=Rhizophora mucronata TaxID=61149 RepID=A0A2P2JEZ9_RHIMU